VRKLLVALFLCISALGFATHNRAGEILYTRIAPFTTVVAGITVPVFTYSIVIITYTDDGPGIADRCEDTIYFGDGQRAVASRMDFPGTPGSLSNCGCGPGVGCGNIIINDADYRVKKNYYSVVHTYSGPGSYTIRFFDPNRNANVVNIPNSVNQPFYVESLLVINSFSGANSSPKFLYDPIDRACVNKCFTHNPGAYDIDGDSLSYEITKSRVDVGTIVPGYSYPDPGPGGQFGIDARTGLLTWCSPQARGEYNIAFIVKEWRKNTDSNYVMIGYMIRDMQVVVDVCPTNDPPAIALPADTCVEAGTHITRTIRVTDPNAGNIVVLTGAAGAFAADSPQAQLSNASAVITTVNANGFNATFTWATACVHVREQPYECVFKAEDNGLPVHLATFNSFNIKVVPPSVKNVTATPIGSNMLITWSPSTCSPPSNPLTAYKIYRKSDCTPFVQLPCQTGVLESSGFTLIGQTSAAAVSYTDTNNGAGLVVGQNYSYVVVAVYADGTLTFGSSQVCAKLKRDIPLMLNVSVTRTDKDSGSIWLRWTLPLTTPGNLDTNVFHGPYTFNVKSRDAGTNAAYTTIYSTTSNYFLALNTQTTQTNINTVDNGKEYTIEFVASGTVVVGSSQRASSVFLTTTPDDRKIHLSWSYQTPWNNTSFIVFRKDSGQLSFVNIATVTTTYFTDTSVVSHPIINGKNYCYKVQSTGAYSDPTVFSPLLNFSEESCATAKDLTPPCTPTLSVDANCPAGTLTVTWTDLKNTSCGDDVGNYILYYKPTINDPYKQVAHGMFTSYIYDGLSDSLISGCYAIQAVDINNNISPMSPDFCIDNCPIFELPNVFTPNGDGTNEFFKAIRVRQIHEINLTVVNRWGTPVYKTTDPYFKWDGVSMATHQPVSEDTFFYICDVFEPRLTGTIKRTLKGFVQVIR